jgi:hypothetical protein
VPAREQLTVRGGQSNSFGLKEGRAGLGSHVCLSCPPDWLDKMSMLEPLSACKDNRQEISTTCLSGIRLVREPRSLRTHRALW